MAAVWPAILLDDKNDNDKVTNVCEEWVLHCLVTHGKDRLFSIQKKMLYVKK